MKCDKKWIVKAGLFLAFVLGNQVMFADSLKLSADQQDQIEKDKIQQKFCFILTDFTSVDMKVKDRFSTNSQYKLDLPFQESLNSEDRESVNSIMQGFVRLLDSWNNSKNQDLSREIQIQEYQRYIKENQELYQTFLKGDKRSIIIGADYLSGYLVAGNRAKYFSVISQEQVALEVKKILSNSNSSATLLSELIKKNGATHLIYGTVGDLGYSIKEYQGYDIKVKNTQYSLDVIIKVVDLSSGAVVYSKNYTGIYQNQELPNNVKEIHNDIFQQLMKNALQQCAEDLFMQVQNKNLSLNKSPLPEKYVKPLYNITINPQGNFLFKSKDAQIFIDNKLLGNGDKTYQIVQGEHLLKIVAEGYQIYQEKIQIDQDCQITPVLKK